MVFRDRSRRRLIRLWLVGGLLEIILVAGGAYQVHRANAFAAVDSLGIFGGRPFPVAPAARDSALRGLAAQGISLQLHGDTLVGVQLSRAQKQELDKAAHQFGEALSEMAPILFAVEFVILALYLAIPIALVIITIRWRRATRRSIESVAPST